ncbi:class I SAM-dependent methyltransferase [Candidatus Bathyarchaeota archaeon]|nr:class I SAM-dependent methyltransferase [Candidatus Bathyarchaeota archaeon]
MHESAIIRRLVEFPYLPSPTSVIHAALNMVEVESNEVFADLGCGDGSVLIEAAKKFEVFCVGFEVDPALVRLAHKKVENAKLKHLIDIVRSDLFTVDLSRLDVIYVYPFPPIIPKLSEKIICECRKGTRILVHDQNLKGLQPTKSVQIFEGSIHIHSVQLYVL